MRHSELKSFTTWALNKQLASKYFVVSVIVLLCSYIQKFYARLQQLWQERGRRAVPQPQGVCLAQGFLSSSSCFEVGTWKKHFVFEWFEQLCTVPLHCARYFYAVPPPLPLLLIVMTFFPSGSMGLSPSGQFMARREFSEVRFLSYFLLSIYIKIFKKLRNFYLCTTCLHILVLSSLLS